MLPSTRGLAMSPDQRPLFPSRHPALSDYLSFWAWGIAPTIILSSFGEPALGPYTLLVSPEVPLPPT